MNPTSNKKSRTLLAISAGALIVAMASGLSSATAATSKPTAPAKAGTVGAKVGSPCSTAGATATVAGKSLTCAKALSGKLVWSASTSAAPTIAGGHDGGPNDGPQANPAFAAAMAKYTACLKAQGVTLPAFGGRGGRRGFGGPDDNNSAASGAKSATPAPRPTLSAKQQAAMTKCASLRPAFGDHGGDGIAGGFGGVPNTPANVAAYISCLNTNGVNISTLADLQGLDRQSQKVSAALNACRAKRVAQTPGN